MAISAHRVRLTHELEQINQGRHGKPEGRLTPLEAVVLAELIETSPHAADLPKAGVNDPYPIVSKLNKKLKACYDVRVKSVRDPALLMHYELSEGSPYALQNFLAVFGKVW